jgi:glycerate 2-kinase
MAQAWYILSSPRPRVISEPARTSVRRASLILNKAELIQNGADPLGRRARRLLLETLVSTLASVDPHKLVLQHVRRRKDTLFVNAETTRLGEYESIYVVGAGKASGAMTEALEKIIGNRLDGGLVVVPSGQERPKLRRVRAVAASHPTPDDNSVTSAKELISLVQGLNERDLLICVISGGGSALLSLPAEPLTIEEKGRVAKLLMNAGATIVELNTVRKHLSRIKGGWLAKRTSAGRILGLVISDVVGDRPDSIASGPISPDPTTFSDAVAILRKYNLWESIPRAAAEILRDGVEGRLHETPKTNDSCFRKVRYHIVGSNRIACLSAQKYLQSKKIMAKVLSSSITGEARYVGSFAGSLAKQIATFNEPFRKPCALVFGGETTVRVTGSGLGGRNQECAMAFASEIQGLKGVAMASIGTDGIDGPTDAAGAIVDGTTLSRSEALNLRFEEHLDQNDSYRFFSALKDLVMTGRTNTNVNDITIAVFL